MGEKEMVCLTKTQAGWLALTSAVEQGVDVIKQVDDLTYRKELLGSTLGEQFRHVLDFINAYMKGISIGRIDYVNRPRDPRIEKDRHFALEQFELTRVNLHVASVTKLSSMVAVRAETDSSSWFVSSVGREQDFVLSHTIHHYALIAEKVAGLGIKLGHSFGVSPSTLEYRQRLAA